MKLRFTLPALFYLCFFSSTILAQAGFWSDIRESDIQASQDDRLIFPDQYRTLQLNLAKLRSYMLNVPAEQAYLSGTPGLLLDFPMPDGSSAQFEVWEAPVMAPELSAKFPEIRSYAGKSLNRPGMLARFDLSPNGLHAMFLNIGAGTVFIDPYARGNTTDYISYFKKDFVKRTGNVFECHVKESIVIELPQTVSDRAGDCGTRREYRLALACTGEYANFHGSFGSDKAPAVAAMNTTMTRVNGVFERDASVRMILVANNEDIIYTDTVSDPYTNYSGSTMLGENQTNCDAVIGSANYDIGHVFSTGGGGIAGLRVPCNNNWKAQGVTGLSNPIGDPFDIDYVAHEMGHQYGANHTQYNDCQRNNSTAMEPGSASTIMGYAGICSPNVQSNSDDYFHAISLQEIGNFVTGLGNSCPAKISTGNAAPSVTNLINRNIPKSTPLLLSGTASDPNGDPLSYCWEQVNSYSNPAKPMPPQSTNSTGPMFRTLLPDSYDSRYCPKLADVLDGINDPWEVLPSVSRSMAWRLTVRDNNPAGGCTTEKNMTITTSGTIGPFIVISPNGGETYPGNSTQTITWNVAGTTSSPVSCANVSILLSTDGGATFNPLVVNTPNDGSQSVTFNAPITNQARILIQGYGNIFYDVSNADFSFSAPLPVELTIFQARPMGQSVQLNWETASEAGNKGFFVERSLGNAHDFSSIAWIDGKGTSALTNRYEYFDRDIRAGGVWYYRLRQTDFDGKVQYSPIRSVEINGVGELLVVSPNPSSGMIRLQLPVDSWVSEARVCILRQDGVQVLAQNLVPGVAELDVSGLALGIYFIQALVGGRSFRGVFMRQ